MKVGRANSTPQAVLERIRVAIEGSEFSGRVFAAGGYPRDILLGRTPGDIDLVVDLPGKAVALAEHVSSALGGTRVATYSVLGTAQFVLDGVSVECVTTSRARPGAGDDASLAGFLAGQDLTINTLAMDVSTGRVSDPTGLAMRDIQGRVVRTAQPPDVSLAQDPHRMLRAVRFAAALAFELDPVTEAGIVAHQRKIASVAVERLCNELTKLMLVEDPVRGVGLLDRTGLLAALLPEVAALKGVDQGTRYHVKDAWGHTLDVLAAVRPDLELRLAALLHDIGKPATRSETDTGVHFYGHEAESARLAGRRLRRLGFANLTTRNVKKLIRHHMYFLTDPTRRQVRRMRARFESDELVIKLAELRHADRLAHRDPEDTDLVPKVRELLATDESTGVRPRSPLTGKDVMDAFGIPPGPEVGRLLRAADEIYFTNPGLDRDSLLTALKGTR